MEKNFVVLFCVTTVKMLVSILEPLLGYSNNQIFSSNFPLRSPYYSTVWDHHCCRPISNSPYFLSTLLYVTSDVTWCMCVWHRCWVLSSACRWRIPIFMPLHTIHNINIADPGSRVVYDVVLGFVNCWYRGFESAEGVAVRTLCLLCAV